MVYYIIYTLDIGKEKIMEFFRCKNYYDMNQNLQDTEREAKVAVFDGEQAAIIFESCTLLERIPVGTCPKSVYI